MIRLVKFAKLPKGTRFTFEEKAKDVWVVLETHGRGLIARWEGWESSNMRQSLCSVCDTNELPRYEVFINTKDN